MSILRPLLLTFSILLALLSGTYFTVYADYSTGTDSTHTCYNIYSSYPFYDLDSPDISLSPVTPYSSSGASYPAGYLVVGGM